MDIHTLYQLFLESTGVTTDSRHCPKGSLFIALRGGRFDGNAYAAQALDKGCAYAVVDNAACADANDPRYLLVDDSLDTLQRLARHHRRQLGIPVLGITGTNGKTTTKELIAAVLQQSHHILYTEGNLNNHIGVPLTLLRLRAGHEMAVVEMGASHPGDIRKLAEIAEPDYGLITNIGKAHLEGFGSPEGVARTKGELFDFLRRKGDATVFVHHDSPLLSDLASGLNRIDYGSGEGLYINGHVTACSPFLGFSWKAGREGRLHQVRTRLIGDYNLPNALAAIAVGRFFGVEAEKVDRALGEYTPCNNRSQLKRTADNTLIIDAYNANPTSMRAAIDNFAQMQAKNKMLILGDMLELGKDSPSEHQEVVDRLEALGLDDTVLVGGLFSATRHTCPAYADADELAQALRRQKPAGKTILIKGSNGMKLASIAEYL